MMNKISAVFGSHVFSDQVMRERLPKAVYKSLKATIDKGEPLDTSIADSVAAAMKEWAMELVQHIILIGSSRLQKLQQRSMTHL